MRDWTVRITDHAARQAERRDLDLETVLDIVRSPQQIVPIREFRQTLVDGGQALIRVLVDLTDNEIVVVTMYRTSKVDKYWQP